MGPLKISSGVQPDVLSILIEKKIDFEIKTMTSYHADQDIKQKWR